MSNWLTAGRQPNGMVIRLQGFDRGVFGGNFHTSNVLPFPPGLDVLCFSNGRDWARGIRSALELASHGRVVMVVDSTALLARRHVSEEEKDKGMLSPYPLEGSGEEKEREDPAALLDRVYVYTNPEGVFSTAGAAADEKKVKKAAKKTVSRKDSPHRVAIITYGNGVPLALEAAAELEGRVELAIVDTPRLGGVPEGLNSFLRVLKLSFYLHMIVYLCG